MELHIHQALHDAEPRASSLCHSKSVRLWGEGCRRHNSSSKQQQSRLNIFDVTIAVVALGRSLYFLSQPPPNLKRSL